MIGRVVPRFLVGCSIVVALVLIVMSVISRRGALVASSARGGECSELRCGDGEFSFTTFTPWNQEHPLQLGQVTPPEDQVPVAPNTQSLIQLDDTDVRLRPTLKMTWWPPVHTSGTAYSANSSVNVLNVPNSNPSSPAAVAQLPNSTKILVDIQLDQLTRQMRDAQTQLASPTTIRSQQSSAEYAAMLNALAAQQRALGTSRNSVASIRAAIGMRASITYERYALPQWLVVGVVLLPVWCAMAFAVRRWRMRIWRRQFGLCEQCGYDMRGNTSGACPECGFGAVRRSTATNNLYSERR